MTRPLRAVLYIRLSKESERSTSISGQNDDLDLIAVREGWEVVRRFEDNGKSGGKERANALAALSMIERDEADVLAVHSYDRWSRQGIEKAADLIRVMRQRSEAGRPALFVAEREGIRSDREQWELQLAFAADVAKKERERTAARQRAARKRMREQGRNPGLGVPPLGYRTGPHPTLPTGRGYVVDPSEAEVIREVAERLISGESTVRIAADLTARKFPRARSAYRMALIRQERGELVDDLESLSRGEWAAPRVRDTWTSEHLLGRVSHQGRPLLDAATGEPLTPFEPILDLSTLQAIRSRFGAARGKQQKRRAARLLSGVAYCGVCGTKQYVKHARGKAFYQCSAVALGKACPQPRIDAEFLETEVVARYLKAWGDVPEFVVRERFDQADTAADLREVSAQIAEIAAALTDDEADEAPLLERLALLKSRRAALLATAPTSVRETVQTGKTFAEAFHSADLEGKRERLGRVLDHVLVFPRGSTERVVFREYDASPFDPARPAG